jgi:hypothetical protein
MDVCKGEKIILKAAKGVQSYFKILGPYIPNNYVLALATLRPRKSLVRQPVNNKVYGAKQ